MAQTVRQQDMDGVIELLHKSGILYAEGVREFKKRFILRVLEQNGGNQCRAARELCMHRNTLSRTIAELKLDIRSVRAYRKQPRRAGIEPGHEQKVVS